MSLSINNHQTNFKANPILVDSEENVVSNPQEDKKGLSKGAKIALGFGAAALSAAVIGGIYYVTKGKVKVRDLSNDIGFEKFKELGGKFEKGVAKNAGGTLFSGGIEKVNKNGIKYNILYKDGKLVESVKNGKMFKKYSAEINKNFNELSETIVTYSKFGGRDTTIIKKAFDESLERAPKGMAISRYKNPNPFSKRIGNFVSAKTYIDGKLVLNWEYPKN